MSAAESIKELPKLSEAERRTVREALVGIANADPVLRSATKLRLKAR